MKCVTYNIQYGIGMDGAYDIGRIADTVRGADLIALQEVSRNNPQNGGHDMVAELREALPEYFSVYAAPYGVDMGSALEDGRAVTRLFEFGNMMLSKTPILSTRNILLPRRRTYDQLNLQRAALEALVATPFGPVRFYSVHLDHTSPDERIAQTRFLMERVNAYCFEGGAVTGTVPMGFPEPPLPEAWVLMGDFNFTPGSPEHVDLVGLPDVEFGLRLDATRPADTALLAGASADRITWIDPKRPGDPDRRRCLDYVFVQASLAPKVRSLRVDDEAMGSDHKPVWVELG